MDILSLETFLRLVSRGSFSRVAKDLGVSQPTVTMRIKALEQSLGVTLVVRVGNSVTLTPEGRVFYEETKRALRMLHYGLDVAAASPEGTRRLALAGTPIWSSYYLPPVLSRFRQLHRDCEISLHTGKSEEVAGMVRDGLADVGVVAYSFGDDQLVSMPVERDRMCWVVAGDHRLAKRRHITIDDIRDEPIIGYHRGTDLRYFIETTYRRRGAQPKLRMELSHVTSVRRMVAEGLGVGFLPWVAVRHDVAAGRLAELQLNGDRPVYFQYTLVTLPERAGDDLVRSFIDLYTRFARSSRRSLPIRPGL